MEVFEDHSWSQEMKKSAIWMKMQRKLGAQNDPFISLIKVKDIFS